MNVYEDALQRYNAKIRMAQYAAYWHDKAMQRALWEDCVREAEFTAYCRERRVKSLTEQAR